MNAYARTTFHFGPATVRRILKQIPEARWDEKTSPERFSLREAISHLADWEPIWKERFVKILGEPGCTIVAYDEDEMARTGNYAERNVWKELDRYEAGRKALAEVVLPITEEQSQIRFNHPERGPLTVEDLVNMIIGHDLYHLEHFSQYLEAVSVGTW